jgi:hypothetical protein
MELNRNAILEFISNKNNFEEVMDIVISINGYDESLSYLEYYYNDEDFFNIYFGINTLDAVRAVCFGDYNYNDDFVRFNGYGNLESACQYEVMMAYDENKEDIADKIIELADVCGVFFDLPEAFYLN